LSVNFISTFPLCVHVSIRTALIGWSMCRMDQLPQRSFIRMFQV